MQELLHLASLKRIPYADRPLSHNGQIQHLSRRQFKKKFNTRYSESIYTKWWLFIKHRKFKNCLTKMKLEALEPQIAAMEQNSNPNLVLCQINPKLGHGLFTSATIKKDSLACIYSGIITPRKKTILEHHYAFTYTHSNLTYNPERTRGLAPFIQHLPEEQRCSTELLDKIANDWEPRNVFLPTGETSKVRGTDIVQEEELYTTQFKPEVLPRLVTANLVAQFVVYKKTPLIAFTATRDIEANEQLGFSYRFRYWNARTDMPEYFDKEANIIPPTEYKRIFGRLQFPEFRWTGSYLKLIPLLKSTGKIDMLGNDGKMYQISAAQLKQELIRVRAF